MIIITAVGADRPGMVHAVASELANAGCNIEDMTLDRLGGEFAMIFIVSSPATESAESLLARFAPLSSSHNISINCKDIAPGQEPRDTGWAEWHLVEVYGADNTVWLPQITHTLAVHNVNIAMADVRSRIASDSKIYVVEFHVELPSGLEVGVLRTALEAAVTEVEAQVSITPLAAP